VVRIPVALRFVVAGTYVFLLLPLVLIVMVSFNAQESFALNLQAPSLRWYQAFFTSPEYLGSMFRVSLPLGLITSLLATLLGSLAAVAVVRFASRGRSVIEGIFMLPLMVPTILLGVGLYLAAALTGLTNGFLGLILGHTLIATPYVIRLVVAGLENIGASTEEAAKSLGCSGVSAFMLVVLPQLRTSIASGAIFAFIVSFSDINLSLFLAGAGNVTIPVRIFSDINWQGTPVIAAASAIQMALICGLVILVQRGLGGRIAA
jgi:putative spermidine/putrescine transport system permease protein